MFFARLQVSDLQAALSDVFVASSSQLLQAQPVVEVYEENWSAAIWYLIQPGGQCVDDSVNDLVVDWCIHATLAWKVSNNRCEVNFVALQSGSTHSSLKILWRGEDSSDVTLVPEHVLADKDADSTQSVCSSRMLICSWSWVSQE